MLTAQDRTVLDYGNLASRLIDVAAMKLDVLLLKVSSSCDGVPSLNVSLFGIFLYFDLRFLSP